MISKIKNTLSKLQTYIKMKRIIKRIKPSMDAFMRVSQNYFDDYWHIISFKIDYERNKVIGLISLYKTISIEDAQKILSKMDEEWYMNLDRKVTDHFMYDITWGLPSNYRPSNL